MDVAFADPRLRALCNDDRRATKGWGKPAAKKLRARLDDLGAAACLDVMRTVAGRCHELKGDRAGQLALDLHGGLRLVFEAAPEPAPRKADGGLDWLRVTAVRVLEVVDYHD